MLGGNCAPKPAEKLPLSSSSWDTAIAKSTWGDVQWLWGVLGNDHHIARLGLRHEDWAHLCLLQPILGLGGEGESAEYPNLSGSQPDPHAQLSPRRCSTFFFCTRGAERSTRGCTRDDRLCADTYYVIIIIILPKIYDERDDYDGYKEAVVSRGCRQRAARSFFRAAQSHPMDALGLARALPLHGDECGMKLRCWSVWHPEAWFSGVIWDVFVSKTRVCCGARAAPWISPSASVSAAGTVVMQMGIKVFSSMLLFHLTCKG